MEWKRCKCEGGYFSFNRLYPIIIIFLFSAKPDIYKYYNLIIVFFLLIFFFFLESYTILQRVDFVGGHGGVVISVFFFWCVKLLMRERANFVRFFSWKN